MDEWTGIQLKLGRERFLKADFSLSKRWREEHLKKKKRAFSVYICFTYQLFLPLLPINTFTLPYPSFFYFAIKWLVSCFEWILNGIHILGLCLSGTQMFVFLFSSNTASNRHLNGEWSTDVSQKQKEGYPRPLALIIIIPLYKQTDRAWAAAFTQVAILFCSYSLLWTEL